MRMGGGFSLGRAAVTLLLLASAQASLAQVAYRCNVQGRTVLSHTPCTTGAGTSMGGYGPAPVRELPQLRASPSASLGRAPEHLQYLSPACAQLNDAIRTASSRGVGHAVQQDLRAEYQAKCADDDRQARQELADAKSAERKAALDERQARTSARALSQREAEQCHEMLRILHGKRQRAATLSAGEQADLQRSEATYVARCKS